MIANKKYLFVLLSSAILCSCKNNTIVPGEMHFTLMKEGDTHVHFNNQVTESDSVNVYINEYMYNGAGVGIGDFNNDGLADIFFGGSMVSSKLYINKGNFQFEDITEKAGVATQQWCTGVSVVDINSDGNPDIYVCSSHSPSGEKRKNLLFINDGHLHFTEQAAAYGLADTGFSTQAVFFDYDKDGDLDMYLLNHRLYNHNANNLAPKDSSGNSPACDRLYRNNGIASGQTHPFFTDVSKEAGIKEDGYGLGVVMTDVNNDGWPDIYVANDYIGNDLLWLNNHNGTFTNIIASCIRHQSYNSMGVDAADINNDGLPELAVLDMLPETNERKKMMFTNYSQERYEMQRRMGYQPSFVRNMLQLNNGVRKINGHEEPFYSEIGQLAGISETDWSWSVLMADLDNDGWKDMYITNGIAKDVTNNDYVAFKNAKTRNGYVFGENPGIGELSKDMLQLLRKNLDQYGSVKTANYFFHNSGRLTFNDDTRKAGLATPSISNGAAYADLDNDGDLDLVTNNMDQPAFVWRNDTRRTPADTTHNFIELQLKGTPGNLSGIGTKVYLYNAGFVQFLEQSPVRGFCSGVDYRLHFGVGNIKTIDSLKIQWPDDKMQVIRNVKANQLLAVNNADAMKISDGKNDNAGNELFSEVTQKLHIDFAHKESDYFDFGDQRALPQKYSQLGPPIACADVNGDGLQDFFVGGAAYQSGMMFIQQPNGSFLSRQLVTGIKSEEDLGAVFFDVDGDKDQDLLVTGGSSEFGSFTGYNHPRLYINDGNGNFSIDPGAFPPEVNSMACIVTTADIDEDGDIDIFIGGRMLPQKYPESPRSYVLRNDHGRFTDITMEVCPALAYPGLVTGALFTDFNNDKKTDLVVCGEWMPVSFFVNENGKFRNITAQTGLAKNGQWRSLQAADLDNDGDIDFIAGNTGINNKFHIGPGRPLELYAGDFDGNKPTNIIPAYFIKDNSEKYELFPALDRNQLADQIPSVKKKFLLHSDYAKTTMHDLLNVIAAKHMTVKDCEVTESAWIENLGNGKFVSHTLPLEAQFAPVNCIIASDMDGDGNTDLLLAGNEYENELMTGSYDASYGIFLKGDGKGSFRPVAPVQSGFILDGDIKCLQLFENSRKERFILAAANDGPLKCFKINSTVKTDR